MAFAARCLPHAATAATQACRLVAAPVTALQHSRPVSRLTVAMASPAETDAKSDYKENEIIFNPLKEGKAEIEQVQNQAELNSNKPDESFARYNYAFESEAAVNQQINHEMTMGYMYHQMSSYFNRDNVALPGFSAFFRAASLEERAHAQQLMDFQARRGGRVKFAAIMRPESDYHHEEKGDALYAMEMALAMEKLNFQMLQDLHEVADRQGDAQFSDFVESMLEEQAEGVKIAADYTATLRRIGKGLPVYEFDRETMTPAAAAIKAGVVDALF